jgi:hypothetical protein
MARGMTVRLALRRRVAGHRRAAFNARSKPRIEIDHTETTSCL